MVQLNSKEIARKQAYYKTCSVRRLEQRNNDIINYHAPILILLFLRSIIVQHTGEPGVQFPFDSFRSCTITVVNSFILDLRRKIIERLFTWCCVSRRKSEIEHYQIIFFPSALCVKHS